MSKVPAEDNGILPEFPERSVSELSLIQISDTPVLNHDVPRHILIYCHSGVFDIYDHIASDLRPVSYTHLAVYKRKLKENTELVCLTDVLTCFPDLISIFQNLLS